MRHSNGNRAGIVRCGYILVRQAFPNRRCFKNLNHSPKHILAAQELATWMEKNASTFGTVKKYRNVTSAEFQAKKGIVFIMNGWSATDHIDIWDGARMKGGSAQYFALGQEVWFWNLN